MLLFEQPAHVHFGRADHDRALKEISRLAQVPNGDDLRSWSQSADTLSTL